MIADDPRLEAAIEQLDIYSFLDEHNVNYSLEGKNIGQNFIGIETCPFCGRGEFHAGIHKNKLFLTCFVCKGYKNIIGIVAFYKHISYKKAKEYLLEFSENNLDVVQRVEQIINRKKERRNYEFDKTDTPPELIRIKPNDLSENSALREFFIKRKLNIWHCHRYGISLSPENKGKIFFPIFLGGKIVCYQWRTFIGNKWYYNSENLGSYIINEDQVIKGKPLVLVEGFLDFVTVDSFIRSYYRDKVSVTSGLVKSVSKKQLQRIINLKPSKIIVMFDNDSWFDYNRIQREIPFDVDFVILPKGKDPNDLNRVELKLIFSGMKL